MRAALAIAGYSRCSSRLLLVSLAAAVVGGYNGMRAAARRPLITLRIEDGARWIAPDDPDRYQCEQGSLLCTAETGRLTSRLYRCTNRMGASDGVDSLPSYADCR
jgi:hypothetical protein